MQSLEELIAATRDIEMTPEQAAEQRRSFVYGNCAFENPLITREMVAAVEAEMRVSGQGRIDL
jgi:hypothetical protein